MDESRRSFILSMTSAYAAISVSAITGTSMVLKSSMTQSSKASIEKPNINSSDWKFSSYDTFSPALIGSAISAFMLDNVEYIYSIIIILLTLFLLLVVGIPGYEYLLPYSELYFVHG